MRKHLLLSLALGASMGAFAQPSVTNAFNANKEGDFEAAATYIEQAIQDPKASSKEKTWRYRGDIYLNIANSSDLSSKFPNAARTSIDSYKKSMELDKYGDYSMEVRGSMGRLQELLAAKAGEKYGKKDFCGAAEHFGEMAEISSAFKIVDTLSIFNSAYCNDQCGKNSLAIEGYKKCAGFNYNVPEVYRYIADAYLEDGKKSEALATLSEARGKFAGNSDILRAEVNIYLGDQEYAKAEDLLKSLTTKEPNNEMFWYVLGITYNKLNKPVEEEDAYSKALAIKPDYYDALFNLGAMHFNKGLTKEEECNAIPPREVAKYNDCAAAAQVLFKKSAEVLEKAYNNLPSELKGTTEERQMISSLKDAYYKSGRDEDYKRMKELLQNK